MRSSFVNLQTIFSFETRLTMVTWKGFQLLHRLLVGLQTSCRSSFRLRILHKELLSPLGISLESRWALFAPGWHGLLALPGIQGEGEGGADGEGELKILAMAGQCMADVHALCCQGRVLSA